MEFTFPNPEQGPPFWPTPDPVVPPERGRRSFSFGTMIAWVVIVGLVVLAAWPQRAARRSNRSTAATKAKVEVAKMRSPQFSLMARYAIGCKASGTLGAADLVNIQKQVDGAAQSAVDRLRVIVIAAELVGPEEAVARINEYLKGRETALDSLDPQSRAAQEEANEQLKFDAHVLGAIYTLGVEKVPPTAASALRERHHWFGELALTWGMEAGNPQRTRVLEPGKRTMMGALAGIGAMGLSFVMGLVLLVVGTVMRFKGKLAFYYRPAGPAIRVGVFGEGFAVYMATFAGFSLLAGFLFPQMGLAANFVLIVLVPVAICYVRMRGVDWSDIQQGLGLHRGRGVLREIGAGILGYLVMLPVLAIGALLTVALVALIRVVFKQQIGPITHPIGDMPLETTLQALQIVLLACVMAPVMEEIFFRGMLTHHLRGAMGWVVSGLISSVLFAAIHPQGLAAIPLLGAIGFSLAMIREWRGSIIASMVTHAINNGVIVGVLVLSHQ